MNPYTLIDESKPFRGAGPTGVGASEIYILAGYGKRFFRVIDGKKYPLTPEILRREKLGCIPPQPDNPAMKWGRRLEPLVIQEFMEQRGLTESDVLRKTEFRHPEYPFAISHPDLVVLREGAYHLQQIKTGSFFSTRRGDNPDVGYDFDDMTMNGIPVIVYLQEQWEMFTSGTDTAGVSLLSNTNNYREFGPIPFHAPTAEKLLTLADRFMYHVRKDIPLKPESLGDVHLVFPEVKPLSITIGGEDEQKIRELKRKGKVYRQAITKLEGKIEKLKIAAALYLGDNKLVVGPDGDELIKQIKFDRLSLPAADMKKNKWIWARVKKYVNMTEVRYPKF